MATRRELIEAVATRYRAAARESKKEILDEFVKVTGFHRKHAIRVLRKPPRQQSPQPRQRSRVYDEAVREALTIVWEAADRICGKRLRQVIAGLVEAMERHGHLQLDAEVRDRLLIMSAATMDRLLQAIREKGKKGRQRSGISTPLRKSIAVRTFGDWHDPSPGYFEMDMVAHCGKSTAGSYVHSLVLTDIATGWTEAVAMIVREQTLVIESVEDVRRRIPFVMRGLDVDNDSAFINDTLVGYSQDQKLELTRCRAYKKNDQAWIEQKNGAVVRRMVGYGRLEGAAATAVLNRLFAAVRFYVNYFQPSFKLLSKTRDGVKVTKKYRPPATPCERLLAREDVSDECKEQLRRTLALLDPVQLLREIREAQRMLAQHEVGVARTVASGAQELDGFVASLATAWRDGEVRPTHRKKASGPRTWRTRKDPFEKVWPVVEQWLNEEAGANAKDLFQRLQASTPDAFQPGQLRTLQRRVRQWRSEVARRLILGVEQPSERDTACSMVAAGGCSTDSSSGGEQ